MMKKQWQTLKYGKRVGKRAYDMMKIMKIMKADDNDDNWMMKMRKKLSK